MDPRIEALKSTSFSGRRLTRQQIADIQETVTLLPNESRNELCKTICEHLNWVTAKGDYKIGACMRMLEHLERHGIVRLPPKRQTMARSATSGPVWTTETDEQPAIAVPLSDLQPLRLEPVLDTAGRQLWNGLVDRHHYLGYKRPFGTHIRYFLVDRSGRRLGCLLFEAATRTLPCRDRWIGWHGRVQDRNRHLLVVNSRYLLFPWVTVKNLASCALGLAARQLSDDWNRLHKCRPVLCETFVDETRFNAVCYRAANWQRIGETRRTGKSRKGVYVLPLAQACRDVLRGEQPPQTATKPLTTAQKGRAGAKDRRFSRQWEELIAAATAVAAREDARWQKRRRVFNSLLIMLFRLPARPGATPAELPDHPVRTLGALPGRRQSRCRRNTRRPPPRSARPVQSSIPKCSGPCIAKSSPTWTPIRCGRGTGSSLSMDHGLPCHGN